MVKNNSTAREGYNQERYEKAFDRIFGTDKERKKRLNVVKKARTRERKSSNIAKSFETFKSDIDGSIISDRRQLREHNRRNGVTDGRDYSPDYMSRRRESISRHEEKRNKKERIEAIQHTLRIKGYD